MKVENKSQNQCCVPGAERSRIILVDQVPQRVAAPTCTVYTYVHHKQI
jgi:hypothetical protein